MGMGFAVTEDFPYKDGYVTAKYGTLGLLRATQCPPIHVSLIEKGTPEQYAYGAKGIGEISSIPIAPAFAIVFAVLTTRLICDQSCPVVSALSTLFAYCSIRFNCSCCFMLPLPLDT